MIKNLLRQPGVNTRGDNEILAPVHTSIFPLYKYLHAFHSTSFITEADGVISHPRMLTGSALLQRMWIYTLHKATKE